MRQSGGWFGTVANDIEHNSNACGTQLRIHHTFFWEMMMLLLRFSIRTTNKMEDRWNHYLCLLNQDFQLHPWPKVGSLDNFCKLDPLRKFRSGKIRIFILRCCNMACIIERINEVHCTSISFIEEFEYIKSLEDKEDA